MSNYWNDKRVVILGGAALIGSHLAEKLVALGVKQLRIVDDLSSGKLENIQSLIDNGTEFLNRDLREWNQASESVYKSDVVFHLACAHGGRGFVGGGHEIELWDNLSLDSKIFRVCGEWHVEKVFFMSSACVYPTLLQNDITQNLYLSEDLVDYDNIQQADGPYGMAKLMAEHTLRAYVKKGLFDGVIGRGFTVYGPRLKENHFMGALISKILLKTEPYEMWGNGEQKRNWGFVDDICDGILLSIEKSGNGEPFNLGVENVYTPNMAAEIAFNIMNWHPQKIKYLLDKPVGPVNRIANCQKAKTILGWEPKTSLEDGLQRTIEWYLSTHNIEDVRGNFEKSLTER